MLTATPQKQDQTPPLPKKKRDFFFQPKLTVNQPNDIYEQEADAVADKVMLMPETSPILTDNKPFFSPPTVNINSVNTTKESPLKKDMKEEETVELVPGTGDKLSFDALSPPPDDNNANDKSLIQRKCAHCQEEEKKVQRKEINDDATVASISTENYIGSLNGKGRSLTSDERKFFEPRMGYDFSNVQLHTNNEANQSAESINALAYTHDNNIVFGSGQYQPGTDEGKRLIAHELTHVVQQKSDTNLISRKKRKDCPRLTYKEIGNSKLVTPQIEEKTPGEQWIISGFPIGVAALDSAMVDSLISDLATFLFKSGHRWMQWGIEDKLIVKGYNDCFGGSKANKKLKWERALFFAAAINKQVNATSNLSDTLVAADAEYLFPNDNETDRSKNRAVLITKADPATKTISTSRYPYDPAYGPSDTNCVRYLIGESYLGSIYPRNAEDACKVTPDDPTNNCVRKCLQTKFFDYLLDVKDDLMDKTKIVLWCPSIWQHHVDCYNICSCENQFIAYQLFAPLCENRFTPFEISAGINVFNRCNKAE